MPQLAKAMSTEMGCPISLAESAQVDMGLEHFTQAISALQNYKFYSQHFSQRDISLISFPSPEQYLDTDSQTLVRREPIGVVGMICAWDWPIESMCGKVASALAAGCTMVMKVRN